MDRRYQAFRRFVVPPTLSETVIADAAGTAQLLTEGKDSEFWQHMKAEIDHQIRAAESRFLDTLAKDYDTYVAFWSRRQALIAVLAIPEASSRKE